MKKLPVVEFVSVIISGDDVEEEDVFRFVIETRNAELHLREHLPKEIDKSINQ